MPLCGAPFGSVLVCLVDRADDAQHLCQGVGILGGGQAGAGARALEPCVDHQLFQFFQLLLHPAVPGRKADLFLQGNPKTTYTLKKEEISTDENGNTVTRVTYYKITGNTVETTTETTLVLKVEKGTVDVDDKDLTTEIKLPSITAKNTDETKTDVIEISSEKLGEMLKDEYYNNVTGEYVYTETVDGKEYTWMLSNAG